MRLYIVTAHRWGNSESHNYIVCVRNSLRAAKKEAKDHIDYRGGKYDCIVWSLTANKHPRAVCTYRGFGFNDEVKGNALDSKFIDINKETED